MAKHGFTLIETILALLVTCMVSILAFSSLNIMSHLKSERANLDLCYAIEQLTQLVNMSSRVDEDGDFLFCDDTVVYLDHQRLVTSPGFNIYLHHIDDVDFYTSGPYMMIQIERDGKRYDYQIGTYQRLSQRICHSDCISDTDDFNEFNDDDDITDE